MRPSDAAPLCESTAAGKTPSDGDPGVCYAGHLRRTILPFRNCGNSLTVRPCVLVRKAAGKMFRTKKAWLRRAGPIGNELLMDCIRAVHSKSHVTSSPKRIELRRERGRTWLFYIHTISKIHTTDNYRLIKQEKIPDKI